MKNKSSKLIFFTITFVVAFCSIVYELVLGQALSAFLGNTILRYSVTIGLYLFAMGVGAAFAEGRFTKSPARTLVRIEILLTLFGAFSIGVLFFAQHLLGENMLFFLLSHSLILIIGVLTGFEIPLLVEIGQKEKHGGENLVLGVDYMGAFVGSLFFSFIFYKHFGLVATTLFVALLNSVAGITVFYFFHHSKKRSPILIFNIILSVIVAILLFQNQAIADYFVQLYIN